MSIKFLPCCHANSAYRNYLDSCCPTGDNNCPSHVHQGKLQHSRHCSLPGQLGSLAQCSLKRSCDCRHGICVQSQRKWSRDNVPHSVHHVEHEDTHHTDHCPLQTHKRLLLTSTNVSNNCKTCHNNGISLIFMH